MCLGVMDRRARDGHEAIKEGVRRYARRDDDNADRGNLFETVEPSNARPKNELWIQDVVWKSSASPRML